MRDFRDAKGMARVLRQSLADRGTEISHSESLELVAKQFGFDNWNVLAAKLEPTVPQPKLVMPAGWFVTGSRPDQYEMGIDPTRPGSPAEIRCIVDPDLPTFARDGFATMMQTVSAAGYRGSRLRFSAELQTVGVTGAGSIWLRIDGRGGRSGILRFDNMEERPVDGSLTGTMDWTRREIVLDVPEEADSVNFGFYESGAGVTRIRGLRLEQVGHDVVETRPPPPFADKPINLDLTEANKPDARRGSVPL